MKVTSNNDIVRRRYVRAMSVVAVLLFVAGCKTAAEPGSQSVAGKPAVEESGGQYQPLSDSDYLDMIGLEIDRVVASNTASEASWRLALLGSHWPVLENRTFATALLLAISETSEESKLMALAIAAERAITEEEYTAKSVWLSCYASLVGRDYSTIAKEPRDYPGPEYMGTIPLNVDTRQRSEEWLASNDILEEMNGLFLILRFLEADPEGEIDWALDLVRESMLSASDEMDQAYWELVAMAISNSHSLDEQLVRLP